MSTTMDKINTLADRTFANKDKYDDVIGGTIHSYYVVDFRRDDERFSIAVGNGLGVRIESYSNGSDKILYSAPSRYRYWRFLLLELLLRQRDNGNN